MGLLISIIGGAIIGFIASVLMHEKSGFIKNVLLGIVGSAVGKFLFSLVGVYATGLAGVIVSIIGACLLIWIVNKFSNNNNNKNNQNTWGNPNPTNWDRRQY